jgi:hypothetical protein
MKHPPPPGRCAFGVVAALVLMLAAFPPLSGCSLAGLAANALPAPTVQARYKGLAGQTAAVMVWVDRGVQMDHPSLRLALAGGLQNKLREATQKKQKEVIDLAWPYEAASVVRFQDDRPELDALPITDIAPRLNVSRLVYVEVENFQTRSAESLDLFRGSMTVTVKVVEVAGGTAKVAYEEGGITAVFPRTSPPEGMPGLGDRKVLAGTVDAITTALAKRFLPHPAEDH